MSIGLKSELRVGTSIPNFLCVFSWKEISVLDYLKMAKKWTVQILKSVVFNIQPLVVFTKNHNPDFSWRLFNNFSRPTNPLDHLPQSSKLVQTSLVVVYNCFILQKLVRQQCDLFPPSLSANKALSPPLSEKLPSVAHILIFQTACEMMSRRCVAAWPVSANKTIVYNPCFFYNLVHPYFYKSQ